MKAANVSRNKDAMPVHKAYIFNLITKLGYSRLQQETEQYLCAVGN